MKVELNMIWIVKLNYACWVGAQRDINDQVGLNMLKADFDDVTARILFISYKHFLQKLDLWWNSTIFWAIQCGATFNAHFLRKVW
jgi:hypothetical protein